MSVFWWMELYFFSLECNEMSSNELWDVYGFGVTLGCPYLGAQGCVPCCWRICLVCLALILVGPCVVLGFSAGMEVLMSSCLLLFLGVRSSLESGFRLKPPASSYQSYFYSSFKTSPSIQHHDKTSTLKMKSFSTVRVTQRGSQRYMEKRRGRRELEVTRMR